MRTTSMDFLTSSESTLIAADVRDMTQDSDLARAVTYRHYTGKTRGAAGAYTPEYTDFTVTSPRNDISIREIVSSGGKYQIGDVAYLFARADVAITPSTEDRIVDGADTYEVKGWGSDPLSVTHRIVARRVK